MDDADWMLMMIAVRMIVFKFVDTSIPSNFEAIWMTHALFIYQYLIQNIKFEHNNHHASDRWTAGVPLGSCHP